MALVDLVEEQAEDVRARLAQKRLIVLGAAAGSYLELENCAD